MANPEVAELYLGGAPAAPAPPAGAPQPADTGIPR
jgi:hypothetical protein